MTTSDNICDACNGTGTPMSGLPCMCKGTGKMSVAAVTLREQLVHAEQMGKAMAQAADTEKNDRVEMRRLLDEARHEIARLKSKNGTEAFTRNTFATGLLKASEDLDRALYAARRLRAALQETCTWTTCPTEAVDAEWRKHVVDTRQTLDETAWLEVKP